MSYPIYKLFINSVLELDNKNLTPFLFNSSQTSFNLSCSFLLNPPSLYPVKLAVFDTGS